MAEIQIAKGPTLRERLHGILTILSTGGTSLLLKSREDKQREIEAQAVPPEKQLDPRRQAAADFLATIDHNAIVRYVWNTVDYEETNLLMDSDEANAAARGARLALDRLVELVSNPPEGEQ
jgi:hypothetical protein